MTPENLGILMDFALITLLAAALVYGFVLNRKINSLHQSKKELAGLFNHFDNTIVKAQHSVSELKLASKEASRYLQVQVDKANVLVSDLGYINDRAGSAADKLEKLIIQSRNLERAQASLEQPRNAAMHKSVENSEHTTPKQLPEGANEARRNTTLENLLERINKRIDTKKKPKETTERPENKARIANKESTERTKPIMRATTAPRESYSDGITDNDRERAEKVLKALGYGTSN